MEMHEQQKERVHGQVIKKLDIKDVPHCKQESLWGLNTHADISEDIGS